MHEILSPLKRGKNIAGNLQKAIDRKLPRTKGKVRRILLSDIETIELLEKQQTHTGQLGPIKSRIRSFSGSRGDLKAGYRLKVLSGGAVSLVTIKEAFQPIPVGQWPGKSSRSGPKALFWAPSLIYGKSSHQRDNRDRHSKYLLNLDLIPGDRTVEGPVNGEQSQEVKNKVGTPPPVARMKNWAQVITTPTADTPGTTLLLFCQSSRYLFGNVSEGTQRVCYQNKVPISKMQNVFLTGTVDWRTTGGIIGLLLTVADNASVQNADRLKKSRDKGWSFNEMKLAVHGGKNLMHMLATTRRFVFRKGVPIDVHEIKVTQERDEAGIKGWEPTFTDENIRVWAIPIKPNTSSRSSRSSTAIRKRSHDEISEDSGDPSREPVAEDEMSVEEREFLNDQIRRGVISHMFDSDWQLDALKVIKLRDVQMPAAIFIRNANGNIEKYEGLLPGGGDLVPDIEVLVRTPWPASSIESLPPTSPSNEAISYIVKNQPQRGRFNPEQAKLLGVKPGAAFGKLTMGEDIKTADGKIVTPDMVMGPGKEGGGFAVVELPDASYIDSLISRAEWSSKEVMDGVGAVVWILGKGLIEDARLLDFQQRHSHLSHIISSAEVSPNRLAMDGAGAAAIRLNKIDPEHYPVPFYENAVSASSLDKLLKASPGLKIQLEPNLEIQSDSLYPLLNTAEVFEEDDTEVQRLAEIARKAIRDPIYLAKLDSLQQDIPSKDAEVIVLGSGSALPSKYRNVSATLVRVPGYGNYLFDCGENTLGQMKRVFGPELPQVLKDLKVVWISHLHADHHLGTASIIKEWCSETSKDQATLSNRLMIASEKDMFEWLEEYSEVEDYGYSRLHLVGMNGLKSSQKIFDQPDTDTYGLSSIEACAVNHCKGSLAGVFTFPNGFKVAYSGDCLPSNEFARIGKGATLLIHEATFDDELAGDAFAKKHCTVSDALRIGKLMGARRILLTHFSQRYQKIPVMEQTSGVDQVAIVAFDYMRIKISDFAKMEHFKPALIELYKDKE